MLVLPIASQEAAEWAGAAATFAAVLVALFGPGLGRWWLRPRLSLQRDPETFTGDELIFIADDDRSRVAIARLVVTNHGRSQADGVEAVLTARQSFGPVPANDQVSEVPEFELPVVSRGVLQFDLGRRDDPRIDLPPRSSRSLQLVMIGTDERIRKELKERGEDQPAGTHKAHGLFCVVPASYADRFTALPADEPTGIEVQLQARNARPSNWKSRVKVWAWENRDEGAQMAGVTLDWLEAVKRIRPRTLATPRRAWLSAHSPWALWRNHRFTRELRRLEAEDT